MRASHQQSPNSWSTHQFRANSTAMEKIHLAPDVIEVINSTDWVKLAKDLERLIQNLHATNTDIKSRYQPKIEAIEESKQSLESNEANPEIPSTNIIAEKSPKLTPKKPKKASKRKASKNAVKSNESVKHQPPKLSNPQNPIIGVLRKKKLQQGKIWTQKLSTNRIDKQHANQLAVINTIHKTLKNFAVPPVPPIA